MAIKVEVVTPTATVSQSAGSSTAIVVVKSTQSPITTNGSKAVVDVVGKNVVGNAIVSTTAPASPYNGLVWIDIS